MNARTLIGVWLDECGKTELLKEFRKMEKERVDLRDWHGYCCSPFVRTDGAMDKKDQAQAGGHEGYGDYFKTGPEFGCVHWEK